MNPGLDVFRLIGDAMMVCGEVRRSQVKQKRQTCSGSARGCDKRATSALGEKKATMMDWDSGFSSAMGTIGGTGNRKSGDDDGTAASGVHKGWSKKRARI